MKDTAIDRKLDSVVALVHENHPDADLDLILKAYQFADKAHQGQVRLSGEPYIIHPVSVAYILAEFKMDAETIAAALLHDVVEDTSYTLDEIEEHFGKNVAHLVDGVTKIGSAKFETKEENDADNIYKMINSMSNDTRVIIIKLADRLHNMRTLDYMRESKQIEKSKEVLEIYAPIANRLGLQYFKSELEDLALKYLHPDVYMDLVKKVKQTKKSREDFIKQVIDQIKAKLDENGIEAKVYGRQKSFYSIYKKMVQQGRDFDEIYDLYAVRIITKTVTDCYFALGIINNMYTSVPGRIKDYIALPKGSNQYQSLHTTVIGPNGNPFEVQIRTEEMHEKDEYGIAAHWRYKEGISNKGRDQKFDDQVAWVRRLMDWKDDTENSVEFVDLMKNDILSDEICVFSPKGKIVELPKGSCPIDFAYRIHSDIGDKCVGANVNGKFVPLNYQLQPGDQVEIKTSKNSKGPSRDWLNYVKSTHAKSKIRQFLKKEEKSENIVKGKEDLAAEIKKEHLSEELIDPKILTSVVENLRYKDLDSLYAAIGYGALKIGTVFQKLNLLHPELFPQKEQPLKIRPKRKKRGGSPVIVAGQGDIDVRFAKCCSPVMGDPIIGYITVGKGISVHRADCPKIMDVKDPSRLVDVEWNTNTSKQQDSFTAVLMAKMANAVGSLVEVTKPFYDLSVPIVQMNSRTEDGFDLYTIKCEVRNSRDLSLIKKKLMSIPGMISVHRN